MIKMLHGLFIASLIGSCYQVIKEAFEPTITAEQWGNRELMHQDIMGGMSVKEQIKNAEKGRYIVTEKHSEPHRDPVSKKVVIENSKLYEEDLKKYGVYQTYKWVEQGKYNLTPEELGKERKRIEEQLRKKYGLL